ncbi:hypothetical protein HNP55_002650 [Paucibacter oligotrophus]|uniref:Carbohydrate binding protein with CBM9 domain n=1 Tax=Roseateles oligotrophus TaxID=1769250 RepID=A0A840L6B8_9BURK|nr:hypothetical protein [Roseateles oligotrophus]MBB4844114.1 hypothetical protein [Roseateles oligotrophus]
MKFLLAVVFLLAMAQPAQALLLPRLQAAAAEAAGWPHEAFAREALLLKDFRLEGGAAAPVRRSELRLALQGQVLLAEFRAWHAPDEPPVARQMRRDVEALLQDDHIALVIDVEGRARNGHVFVLNSAGTQFDALIVDGVQMRRDWDGLWQASVEPGSEGWTARFLIPLATLGHSPAATSAQWRFNAQRWSQGGLERQRLAGWQGGKELSSLGDTLLLQLPALDGQAQAQAEGLGLRLKPSLRWTAASARPEGQVRQRLEPGLELFHQADSGLRSTLALNLDFGEAEADERELTLDRFELLREEKREFFLQDAGFFSFGGLQDMSPMPYYSRRVGLDAEGRARSLRAGLKFSGTVVGLDFGVLAAEVDAGESQGAGPRVGVMRVARALGPLHRIGLIATQGHPAGKAGSALSGLDYRFRDTALAGDKTLEFNLWQQRSSNAGLGAGEATGGSLAYPNLGLGGEISVQRVSEHFEPALGYLAEAGVWHSEGALAWWHRNAAGDDWVPGVDWNLRRKLDGSEATVSWNPELRWSPASGDMLMLEWFLVRDRLAHSYEPLPGVALRPGQHDYQYLKLMAESSRARVWGGGAELRVGPYFDGRRQDMDLHLFWQPSTTWAWQGRVGAKRLQMPAAAGRAYTASLRLDHAPSMAWANSLLVQWDSVSEQLGLSARLRWRIQPGRELLFSFDHLQGGQAMFARESGGPGGVTSQQGAQLKLVWGLQL